MGGGQHHDQQAQEHKGGGGDQAGAQILAPATLQPRHGEGEGETSKESSQGEQGIERQARVLRVDRGWGYNYVPPRSTGPYRLAIRLDQ